MTQTDPDPWFRGSPSTPPVPALPSPPHGVDRDGGHEDLLHLRCGSRSDPEDVGVVSGTPSVGPGVTSLPVRVRERVWARSSFGAGVPKEDLEGKVVDTLLRQVLQPLRQ